MTMTEHPTQYDSDECRAASAALVVAADRLHRAVAAASPTEGQEFITTLRLAGVQPVVTILQTDAGAFTVRAGMIDRDNARNLDTYERQFVRSDALPAH
ncbi:MAG: hypothetical protein IPK42_15190 [Betaproteobacteria bacterium]|nr:hypothetical protein [Betaproteobacteria bacterium]